MPDPHPLFREPHYWPRHGGDGDTAAAGRAGESPVGRWCCQDETCIHASVLFTDGSTTLNGQPRQGGSGSDPDSGAPEPTDTDNAGYADATPPPDESPDEPLWPHQAEAIDLCCKHLADAGRATLIMACGTGKSRTGATVTARLAPRGRRLILAPTVELLAQLVAEYRRTLGAAGVGRELAVCSDDIRAAGKSGIDDLHDQHAEVTTDPGVIARIAASGPATVVATYASLPAINRAHGDHGLPAWDVVIADEAHRTVAGRVWPRMHDDGYLPARRRLYMTATPRMFTDDSADSDTVGMDDEATFGPTIYQLGYAEAIDLGLLAPYRLVVAQVCDDEIRSLTDESAGRQVVRTAGTVVSARMLAVQVAVLRAAARYGIGRMISFHARVEDAREFAATLPGIAAMLPEQETPASVWASHMCGDHDSHSRRLLLRRLADGVQDGLAIVSNARLLGEGVDIPTVDGVIFANPRNSMVDVIQAIGRAVRRGPHADKIATIVVPLLTSSETSAEAALESSDYAPVWHIVQALRAHDETLAADLGQRRQQWGRNPDASTRPLRWLEIDGADVPDGFSEAITLRIIRSTTSRWDEFFGAACQYRHRKGHVDIPKNYVTKGGLRLGNWWNGQRTAERRGQLLSGRRAWLLELGMVFDPARARWERGMAAAEAFHAENGHLIVPDGHVRNGLRLDKWVENQRINTRLDDEQRRRLVAAGLVFSPREEAWEHLLQALSAFRAKNDHVDVPYHHVDNDGFPLGKRVAQLKYRARKGRLAPERQAILTELGIAFDTIAEEGRQEGVEIAQAYYRKHGDLRPQIKYVTEGNFPLGQWMAYRRHKHWSHIANGTECDDLCRQLTDIDPRWADRKRAFSPRRHHGTG